MNDWGGRAAVRRPNPCKHAVVAFGQFVKKSWDAAVAEQHLLAMISISRASW